MLAGWAVVADPVPYGTEGSMVARWAHYVDPSGGEHDVVVTVTGRLPVGSTVRVWLDREGRMVDSAPDRGDAAVLGAMAAIGIAIACGLVLGGA